MWSVGITHEQLLANKIQMTLLKKKSEKVPIDKIQSFNFFYNEII